MYAPYERASQKGLIILDRSRKSVNEIYGNVKIIPPKFQRKMSLI